MKGKPKIKTKRFLSVILKGFFFRQKEKFCEKISVEIICLKRIPTETFFFQKFLEVFWNFYLKAGSDGNFPTVESCRQCVKWRRSEPGLTLALSSLYTLYDSLAWENCRRTQPYFIWCSTPSENLAFTSVTKVFCKLSLRNLCSLTVNSVLSNYSGNTTR